MTHNTSFLKSIAFVLALATALLMVVPAPAWGQATTTKTTLSAALANPAASSGANPQTQVYLASATNVNGQTSLGTTQTILVVDSEVMDVISVSGTTVTVTRATRSSKAAAHNSGAIVWVGPPGYFGNATQEDPPLAGSCTPANIPALPHVRIPIGDAYDCPTSGTLANQWVRESRATADEIPDAFFWQPFSDCIPNASGNTTGTNGNTLAGSAPVVQNQTTNSSTNTHNYLCVIHVPSSLSTYAVGHGAQVKDVQFYYGVQTTGLGTQVFSGSAGTMNSALVFSYVNLPTPGTSETPSSATPVRADSGTLVMSPTAANFNVGTTTAGSFDSVQFTPATPIAVNTDRQLLLLNVALLNTATSATVTNSPGFLVHMVYTPF